MFVSVQVENIWHEFGQIELFQRGEAELEQFNLSTNDIYLQPAHEFKTFIICFIQHPNTTQHSCLHKLEKYRP